MLVLVLTFWKCHLLCGSTVVADANVYMYTLFTCSTDIDRARQDTAKEGGDCWRGTEIHDADKIIYG